MGYKQRAHLMNDMLPGLNGGKMSASLPESKIDCLDPPGTVRSKILAVRCKQGDAQTNGLLAIVRLILIPLARLRHERSRGENGFGSTKEDAESGLRSDAPTGTVFSMSVNGTTRHYRTYLEVEHEYMQLRCHESFKLAVAASINQLLARVRESYFTNPEWQAVEKLAYPGTEEE